MNDDGAQNPVTTRDRILQAATAAFSMRGYEAVGVQAICSAVGITKPSLYYHFPSKEAILDSACRLAYATMRRHLSQGLSFSGDLVVDVREVFAASVEFARRDPATFNLVVQTVYSPERSTTARVSRDEVTRMIDTFTELFREARGAYGNVRGKERFLGQTLIGTALTLGRRHAGSAEEEPPVRLAAQTFLYGAF